MTSQGSSYARFRRAVANENPTLVLTAAAEVGRLTTADALRVVLVLIRDAARFERAVVRWHALCCLELRVRTDESQLILAALMALGGPARNAAAEALLEMFERHDRDDERQAIQEWLDRRPA